MQQHGGRTIGTRWIDINKGDEESPDYRSRLVGKEFNVGSDPALYAATPPLEALRLIVSLAATTGMGLGEDEGHDQLCEESICSCSSHAGCVC